MDNVKELRASVGAEPEISEMQYRATAMEYAVRALAGSGSAVSVVVVAKQIYSYLKDGPALSKENAAVDMPNQAS